MGQQLATKHWSHPRHRSPPSRPPRRRWVYFWSGPDFGCPDPHPDTDETALREGYITVTPLHFNLTDAAMLASYKTELFTRHVQTLEVDCAGGDQLTAELHDFVQCVRSGAT